MRKLKRSEVLRVIDGESWNYTNRKKTDTLSRIPLLPSALEIMERYQENPQCQRDDRVLPVLSNQKMNAYLKEIADLSGISRMLTFHIASHTFATTVTLNNGVPI
ncbi:integrase [Mucilaginibacter sp. CAU 1740]|uniref:integrase n=1 Tax=Mucilaginibacter sp. CAU 1740 TaxID=3140365 RepID=UPI00325BFD3C